jgi:ABC-type lipoprotein export system ATPase subunit
LHAAGRTIIMVTHDEEVARHAKRIVRLRDGRIVSDEPTGPK